MHRKAVRSADGAETVVLRDLRFELKPGSFTCLIGPSGCGKTTTLKIILDLDRDYEGTVTLMPAGLRMAAVFQEPRLLPWRTVERSEEHTSELQSLMRISYAVFCLKKKNYTSKVKRK